MLDELVQVYPEFFRRSPFMQDYFKKETHILKIFSDKASQPVMDDFGEDKFIIVLGLRGSGKSNTAGVLMEEFLTKKVPIVVLDVKDEYYTLGEDYEITVIGDYLSTGHDHYDERLTLTDPKALAARVIKEKESVILSFLQLPPKTIFDFSNKFFQELYELEKAETFPILIFVEEAQIFIPYRPRSGISKEASKQLKEIMEEIALRGRSIGVGACFIAQRSQLLDKDVITQAEHMFLHKVTHPLDQEVYRKLIPAEKGEIADSVPKLARGNCVYVHSGEATIRHVRKKRSRDVSSAPTYDKVLRWYESLRGDEENGKTTNSQGGSED